MLSQRFYGTSSFTSILPDKTRSYGTLSSYRLTKPAVPRSYLPSRTTRKERYTRCLSTSCLPLSSGESTADSYGYSKTISSPTKISLLTRWWKKPTSTLCTPDQLLDIIREPVGYYALPSDPCNEVYSGIYLSDAPTAMCTSLLKRMGVTHVLNAAQGKERRSGQVNTWPGFYSHSGIKFLGVEAFDNVVFRLYPYFEEAAQFIDDALASGGKVLVHCRAGISRSATLVCAFLMLKRNMSAQEAVRTVRKHRAIIPNDGFLQQLCDLNDKLGGHRPLREI